MYDLIILGATFTAAGIAQTFPGSCLILESKPLAGYEFLSACHYGADYHIPPVSPLAQRLHRTFTEKGAFANDRICLFDCAAPFYALLEDKDVLLNTHIIHTEKTDEVFCVTVHGVNGFRTFTAKRVIDTRCNNGMICGKTYNMLIEGTGDIVLPEGVIREEWGFTHNYVLRCAVVPDATFITAHKRAMEVLETLPEGHKVILLADDFDYQVKPGYPKSENGILMLPSKAFANPILALDAGVSVAQKEV